MGRTRRFIDAIADGDYWTAGMTVAPTDEFKAAWFNAGSGIHKSRLSHHNGLWRLNYRDREEFWLPRPDDAVRFTRNGGYGRVYAKYVAHPEITIRPNTTVVDIGAFIGEFSRPLPRSCTVVAVEPDPRSVRCLRRNTNDNVSVVEKAAWNEEGHLDIDLGSNGSETSVFGTDDGQTRSTVRIPTVRVDTLVTGDVELLKVEAEGAEPEALEGAIGLEPFQIVVDVSEERGGESTHSHVLDILHREGYRTSGRGDVLIGIRE
jgi:FkbM family methyltransferase